MRRFIILFDEKEGTSALARLLDNFPNVSIVHQAGGGGWEPFDRHNCGPMALADLRYCLAFVFAGESTDLTRINRRYMKTATQALAFDADVEVVGFKMRFVPPRLHPRGLRTLAQRTPLGKPIAAWVQQAFERTMLDLFAHHGVKVFVAVRRDTLRWALSKYHGDGSGRPGHLQFKLAEGGITREAIGRFEVDIERLSAIMRECEAKHAAKRQLLATLQARNICAHALFYEDFLTGQAAFLQRIFALLDAPTTASAVQAALDGGAHYEKVHADDIAEFVTNHAQVLARFGDRKAAHWD